MQALRGIAATALLLALVSSAHPGLAAGPAIGVTTDGPVQVSGLATVAADRGDVLLRPGDAVGLSRLDAEAIVVETAWERGAFLHGPSAQVIRHVTEEGRDRTLLEDASMAFERATGTETPLFLLIADAPAHLLVHAPETLTIAAGAAEQLAAVGASPQEVRASGARSAGFWHATDGEGTKATGPATLLAKGSFTLFVHDLRLSAQAADGHWTDWTGYRESEGDTGPAEYELRVTTLEVQNGTFTATARSDLALHLPSLQADIDGSVFVAHAEGRLAVGKKAFVFEDDPLHLTGGGTLLVSPERDALRLRPSESWTVNGERAADIAAGLDVTARSPIGLGGALAGFALVATAGSMATGHVPAPTAALRRRQYERWLRLGGDAASDADWARASRCYRRATRMCADGAVAWFEWAHTELVRGNGEMAERIAKRASRLPDVDRLDLLDLRASAAWERGDREALAEHLHALAAVAPDMAHGLVRDLGIDPDTVGLPVTNAARRDKGGIDGYA